MVEDYVIEYEVPVFDSHGEYTDEVLAVIVDNCNKRILDTGDEVPVIIGHTVDGKDEDEQPEIVGMATAFSLGEIGDVEPRKCIMCTMKFYRDKYEQHDIPRQYPRRSVELWTEELFIDPIALLGPTTPARSLGLMGKNLNVKKYQYSFATYQQGDSMDKENIVKELYAMLSECEEFAWVRQQIKNAKSCSPEDMKDKSEDEGVEKKSKPEDEEESESYKEKNALLSSVEKFKRENDSLKEQFNLLQKKFRRAERSSDLVRLESNEGITFEMEEELSLVEDMSEESYQKHLERMRKRYQRAPVNVNLNIASVPDYGKGDKQFSALDMERAIELSRKGLDYSEAILKVKGG